MFHKSYRKPEKNPLFSRFFCSYSVPLVVEHHNAIMLVKRKVASGEAHGPELSNFPATVAAQAALLSKTTLTLTQQASQIPVFGCV